jgi:hypothetical protein
VSIWVPGQAEQDRRSGNLLGADAVHRMGDEFADDGEETDHVGELDVRVEGGFVAPFGVNVEDERRADGFEEVDTEAAGFGARGLENAEQFVAELLVLAGSRFETDESVKGHGALPRESVSGFGVGRKEADGQIAGGAQAGGGVENHGNGIDDDGGRGDVAVRATGNDQADVGMAGERDGV